MPILLEKQGFKFFFYANEHAPMHIHIEKGDEYLKLTCKQCMLLKVL